MSDALPQSPSSGPLEACESPVRQPAASSAPAICGIAPSAPLLSADFSGEHGGVEGGSRYCGGQCQGPPQEGDSGNEQLALVDSPLSTKATAATRVDAEVHMLESEMSPLKASPASGVNTQADPPRECPESPSSAGVPRAADMMHAPKLDFREDGQAVSACYTHVEGCTAPEAEVGPQPAPATATSASKENRAADAEADSPQELLIAVPSEENHMLQGDLDGLQPQELALPRSALPAASPFGSLSRGDVLSAVPESAPGPRAVQEESACNTVPGNEALKARRGKAPGAPPSKRSLQGKAKGELPCKQEASSVTEDLDKTCRLWGWRPAGDPLTTLRGCCTDHLLVEGKCSCTGEPSGDVNPSNSSKSLTAEVCPDSHETSWLLDLEAIVHSSLKDSRQQVHGDRPPTPERGAARDVLKSFVEEIGFSVLELRDEEAGECSIAADPRLLEWFRRPTSPLKSGRLAWSGAGVASAAAKERGVARFGSAQKKEPASLPATLRKSISISLSALRRGSSDRLNFLNRLQRDILQCSLSSNAIELLLELLPDMSAATDRRQLWVEAREMLARCRENIQRPLDDEETFSAFVFEFGDLRERLELLLFLSPKNIESHISSLLVQVQLKLDCLAMLRRRAPKIARCVRAVAVAAAVVSGLPQTKVCPMSVEKAAAHDEGKENRGSSLGDGRAASTGAAGEALRTGEDVPAFRWPLLFQMVQKHCGFSPDGSFDRSRSLLKVIASHVGKPIEGSELTLLRRASQKSLAVLLEQQASLVRVLLLLHRAASCASSNISATGSAEPQVGAENPALALAARLLRSCHCAGETASGVKRGRSTEGERTDALFDAIPKLVKSHRARLETLARQVAQLLREYAAFVCWMGDKDSFLPVQLHDRQTGSKKEQQGTHQGAAPPAFLGAFLSSATLHETGFPPKLDAFECLNGFFEKLIHHAEPVATDKPMRKFSMQRKCSSSSSSASPHSSTSSLLPQSPGSSPERRVRQKIRQASAFPFRVGQQATKIRCFPLPGNSTEQTSSGLPALLARQSALLRPPKVTADASAVPHETRGSGASGSQGPNGVASNSPFVPLVLRMGSASQSSSQGMKPSVPLWRLSSSQSGCSTAVHFSADGEAQFQTVENPLRGPRRVFPFALDRKHFSAFSSESPPVSTGCSPVASCASHCSAGTGEPNNLAKPEHSSALSQSVSSELGRESSFSAIPKSNLAESAVSNKNGLLVSSRSPTSFQKPP